MGVDRTSSLTESQRTYLRMVFQHKSSKEIAQMLGISAHTVDKRIKEAMRILDVGSRVEAARMLAAAESEADCPLGPQSPDLAIPPVLATLAAQESQRAEERVASPGVMVGEELHVFRALSLRPRIPLPVPTAERPENNLTALQRLGWTIGLIIGLALATGILLSGLTALGTLLVTLRH